MKTRLTILMCLFVLVSMAQDPLKKSDIQVKRLNVINRFIWQGDTIKKDSLVYAKFSITGDSVKFKNLNGTWSGWFSNGTGGTGIALTDLSASSPVSYNNTTGVFSVTSGYTIPTSTEKGHYDSAYGWGNWASNFGTTTGKIWGYDSHPTTTSGYGLPSYPTTLPASDVYSWAKASTKPTYNYAEVGAEATLGNPSVNGYVLASTTGGTRSWVAQTGGADGNNYPTSLSFSTSTGTLTLGRNGLTDLTASLNGRYLTSETDPTIYSWAKASSKPSYSYSEVGAEASLGYPSVSGYVLSSTTGGTRSWVAMSGGSMVYPGSGIAVSTGSSWGTSITNNSSNWNTAYGWGNWASNFGTTTGKIWGYDSHPTTTSGYGLPSYPTTLPASDVYSWAKASTKPTYNYAEVGAAPQLHVLGSHSDVGISSPYANQVLRYNGSEWGNAYVSTLGVEMSLGNPSTSGYVLSSTSSGTRSWVARAALAGSLSQAFSASFLSLNGNWKLSDYSGAFQIQYSGGGIFSMSNTGDITAHNFIGSSDRRLKQHIRKLDFSNIDRIRWVDFEMKDTPNQERSGVIAQQLERIGLEKYVRTDNKGMKSVAYIDLLCAKVAQMDSIIKSLQHRIKILENVKK